MMPYSSWFITRLFSSYSQNPGDPAHVIQTDGMALRLGGRVANDGPLLVMDPVYITDAGKAYNFLGPKTDV